MNIFKIFEDKVKVIVAELMTDGTLPDGLVTQAISAQPPRDASHGDMAINAAMVLAKPAGMAPRALADILAARLEALSDVEVVEIAGPGFINLRLARSFWYGVLANILSEQVNFGRSSIGTGEKVNVEYVSANPTGPMHVGHCRGAVFGDSLANLLEFAGFDVCREYYINDAGAQVDSLARSVHLRYREVLGESIGEIPAGLYPGAYLQPVAQDLVDRYGDAFLTASEEEWLPIVRAAAVEAMMAQIRTDLAELGISHDVFFSEKTLHTNGGIDRAVKNLDSLGLVYKGVLEPPKGKKPDDWEERPQVLFKATEFGDDVDRPLQKSDGSWTYFAADIAYHYDKYTRGYPTLINVWGADHGGYVKRVDAAIKAMTESRGELDVKLVQMVNLFKNGEPYKMSKRAGTFVTLKDVVDEVGRDVTRFIMLTRKNNDSLDFDFAQVLEQEKENPVFYVQYAHARVRSVLRTGMTDFADYMAEAPDFSLLEQQEEIAVIQMLATFPRVVEQAALAHEPHRIAFFLNDVAASIHQFWSKGKENPALRIVLEDQPALTRARLAMVEAAAVVIGNGLAIMGVHPVEEM